MRRKNPRTEAGVFGVSSSQVAFSKGFSAVHFPARREV